MVVTLSGRLMDSKPDSTKARSPIVSKLSGRSRVTNCSHLPNALQPMVFRFEGSCTVFRLLQLSKVPSPVDVRPLPNFTDVRVGQSAKARLPSSVTLLGMVSSLMLHPMKAYCSIFSVPSWSVTEVMFSQPEKALPPMVFTLPGITTDVNPLPLLNTLGLMTVVPSGITISVISFSPR